MKISVQYSTLIVKDLSESVSFYRDVLGFTEGYHVDLPNNSAITIMNSTDGASVELIESPQFEVGLYSIGMDVDDLDKAIRQLEKNGYRTEGDIVQTTVGRQIFVLDPSGVRICLIEHSEEYREKYMRDVWDIKIEQAVDEETRDVAEKMIRGGKLSHADIAEYSGLTDKQVEDLRKELETTVIA